MLKIGANAILAVDAQRTIEVESDTRVFIVGDLDGSLTGLKKALSQHNFAPSKDRLICLGDIIDRGSETPELFEYLTRIKADFVLGNHEHLMLEALLANDAEAIKLWCVNGGTWHTTVEQLTLKKICDKTLSQSLSIVLKYRGKTIGLSHTLPQGWDWSEFPQNKEFVIESLLWSRELYKSQKLHNNTGVDFSIHGHNSTQVPTWIGNTHHIDTNYYGRPTVVNLDKLIQSRYR